MQSTFKRSGSLVVSFKAEVELKGAAIAKTDCKPSKLKPSIAVSVERKKGKYTKYIGAPLTTKSLSYSKGACRLDVTIFFERRDKGKQARFVFRLNPTIGSKKPDFEPFTATAKGTDSIKIG